MSNERKLQHANIPEVNYELVLLDSNKPEAEALESAFNEIKRKNLGNPVSNAVVLSYTSHEIESQREYVARVFQNGDWVKDKNQQIIQISMKEYNPYNTDPTYVDMMTHTAIMKVDAERHYELSVTENTDASIISSFQALIDKNRFINAVMIYPNVNHAGSNQNNLVYTARFIQNGSYVEDEHGIKEVSIALTPKNLGNNLQSYLYITNKALVQADIPVPNAIKTEMAQKDMSKRDKKRRRAHDDFKKELEKKSKQEEHNEQPPRSDLEDPDSEQPQPKTTAWGFTSYNPETKTEAVPNTFFLPPGVTDIALGFVGNDFQNQPSTSTQPQITFFGTPFLDMLHTEATQLGNMILQGEDKNIEIVLASIRQNPSLLNAIVTAKDPNGTLVTGTLLQIAAMAGDVNLKPKIEDETQRGLVERLAEAGGLSKDEVAKALECVNSQPAIQANEARVARYLAIIEKFGTSLCDGENITATLAQFEKDLDEERKKPVSSGLILDPIILHHMLQWVDDNTYRFEALSDNKCDAFFKGLGKLQSKLPARFAQLTRVGLSNLVHHEVIPPRTLNNSDNTSDFYNSNSRLGIDFHLGAQNGSKIYNTDDLTLVSLRREISLYQTICQTVTQTLQSYESGPLQKNAS